MRKAIALSAYLKLRQSRSEPLGDPPPRRPKGPLVWVHCEDAARLPAIRALMALLTQEGDEVSILVTTKSAQTDADLILQPPPEDSQPAARSFLNHWRPDVLVWLDGPLRPALISQAAERSMTCILLDVTATHPEAVQRVPGLARALLPMFDVIVCAARDGVQRSEAAGVPAGRIRQALAFDPSPKVPACDPDERAEIAQLLGARPMWLAARPTREELAILFAAHHQASRLSHKLLLILACDDHGPAQEALTALGMAWHQHAPDATPPDNTQVLIADAQFLGLWYQLAPLTFIGGSLSGGAAIDPFDPAGLGSVVIHGPQTGRFVHRFQQLIASEACCPLTDQSELGDKIETLLAPDKAALIAHAAWDVTSRGAETAQMVTDAIFDALDQIGR